MCAFDNFCFFLQPFSNNIYRSLVREPKVYLWDWSLCMDPGAKFENMVASHIWKSVQHWNEEGLGDFGFYYLRDKDQKEVDLIVTKNNKPWILVEAKLSDKHVAPSLIYFHKQTQAPYAFQVVQNMPYIEHNCFEKPGLFVVPASTFLSQLV